MKLSRKLEFREFQICSRTDKRRLAETRCRSVSSLVQCQYNISSVCSTASRLGCGTCLTSWKVSSKLSVLCWTSQTFVIYLLENATLAQAGDSSAKICDTKTINSLVICKFTSRFEAAKCATGRIADCLPRDRVLHCCCQDGYDAQFKGVNEVSRNTIIIVLVWSLELILRQCVNARLNRLVL